MPDTREASLRAVIYDVDGTMYRLRSMRMMMALQLGLAMLGRPFKTRREVRIIRAYRKCQELLRDRPAPPGADAADQDDPQLLAAAEKLGLETDEIRPVVTDWMQRRPLRVLPLCRRQAVLDTIRAVHAAGVRQGVYSDYPPQDKLRVLGVADCIDAVVWSGQPEVGRYKPAPQGFLHAARLLDVEPAAAVYVGDRPEVDGAGARAAGMQYLDVTELKKPQVLLGRLLWRR